MLNHFECGTMSLCSCMSLLFALNMADMKQLITCPRARALAKFTLVHHLEGGELKSVRIRYFSGKCTLRRFCMMLEQNNR